MQSLGRDEFLKGLWSYWLFVGIALRRVRRGAESEKVTTLLLQLWKERAKFAERPFGDVTAGYWPERQALWMRRSHMRELLQLPTAQFPDDDAVNIFYSGQAFYDRATIGAAHEQVRAWRVARYLAISARVPAPLRSFASKELQVDLDRLMFPGVYLDGYDDATVWIGRIVDEDRAKEVASRSPGDRALCLQQEPIVSSPETVLLEPVLRALLQTATVVVPHRDTLALLTHAVQERLLPPSVAPQALAYLLFVQTEAIVDYRQAIVDLIGDRWAMVREVFAAQSNSVVARRALVLLSASLCDVGFVDEPLQLLHDLPHLLDADTVLALLRILPAGKSGGRLFAVLADVLRIIPTTTHWHRGELEYLAAVRNIAEAATSADT